MKNLQSPWPFACVKASVIQSVSHSSSVLGSRKSHRFFNFKILDFKALLGLAIPITNCEKVQTSIKLLSDVFFAVEA